MNWLKGLSFPGYISISAGAMDQELTRFTRAYLDRPLNDEIIINMVDTLFVSMFSSYGGRLKHDLSRYQNRGLFG